MATGSEKSVNCLSLSDIKLAYDNTPVCSGVSLEVCPGEIVGILGPNGCGKSTLLSAVSNPKHAVSGTVSFPPLHGRQRVAVVPQNYRQSFFEWASLLTNIRISITNGGYFNRRIDSHILRIHRELDMDIDLRLRPSQCSGGMLQQAAILRALCAEPTVLLADEPFSALDIEVASRVKRQFRDRITNSDICVLLVLHGIDDLVEVCDKIFIIPGRPYTTSCIPGHETAALINNRLIGKTNGTAGSFRTMVSVLEGALDG